MYEEFELKAKQMRDIENFRELKKREVLKETIQSFFSKEKAIIVSFG